MTARIAALAFLALIFTVAALVFPRSTWAASGNVQVCHPNASCTIGEFLYSDSYTALTTATCSITSRYPDGGLFLNAVNMPVSSEGDGWYAHTFTTPTTLGLYRTEVKCVVGSDTMALDKSFEIQTAPSTLTSNDAATAVWGYSNRSLSSFGTLIADIWNSAARTLTGTGLLSGSLATKSDVDSAKDDIKSKVSDVKTKVESIESTTTSTTSTTNITNIQNITNETRNLLEQIINKPVIENGLDSGVTFNLESKIDSTKLVTGQINTKVLYLQSKSSLVDNKWANLDQVEIADTVKTLSLLVGEQTDQDKSSILGLTNWLKEQWSWQETEQVYKQANLIQGSLSAAQKELELKGKTSSARQNIKSVIALASKLQSVVGNSSSVSDKTLHGRINGLLNLSQTINTKSSELNLLFSQLTDQDIKKRVDQLSKEVAQLNQLPKVSKMILAKSDTDEKGLKNRILGLKGVLGANKDFLSHKPGKPFASTWLELGSIVFKTLITNPSSKISQIVPLKYYLPTEVKRENIVEKDEGLTVNYDAEKDQYFVLGQFTLSPGESKTLTVTIDDKVFELHTEELEAMKKQAEELSKPLQNTAYFAQGTVLKSDVDASLNKIISLQKNAITPEEKIRAYREGHVEYQAAKEKLEKLKELATNAGSVGTLFGFVGGAQAIAVWGLIIVMAAGFVFLTLYLRQIKKSEMVIAGKEKVQETINSDGKRSFRHYKMMAVIAIGLIGTFAVSGVALTIRQGMQKEVIAQKPQEEQPIVLGSKAEKVDDLEGEQSTLFVPEAALVSIHSEPNLNSAVLATLEGTQEVLKIESVDGWVRVVIEPKESGEKIAGWVDGDFLEDGQENTQTEESREISSNVFQLITIADTPTGFLRVRSGPWGEELGKVDPGTKYPIVDSKGSWLQIVLDDGSLGWVFDKYIVSSNSATGGY